MNYILKKIEKKIFINLYSIIIFNSLKFYFNYLNYFFFKVINFLKIYLKEIGLLKKI